MESFSYENYENKIEHFTIAYHHRKSNFRRLKLISRENYCDKNIKCVKSGLK